MIGEAGVQGFGLRAEAGRKWFWDEGVGVSDNIGADASDGNSVEAANKLYVGMLIMLIFAEALAL